MKKKLLIFCSLALGAMLLAGSCTKDESSSKSDDPQKEKEEDPKDDDDPQKQDDPSGIGITITDAFAGTIKAGFSATINIKGEGFDEETDKIYIGWPDADTLAVEYQYDNPSMEIRSKRVTFGLDAYTAAKGKTVKVYLERDGYDDLCISGDIVVNEPEVSDGYIPDPQFRADLTIKNPAVEDMFSSLNLLDVDAARKLVREPNPVEGWPFDISWAVSDDWRGMELFESLGSETDPNNELEKEEGMNVAAWFSPNIKVIDCSNWLAPLKLRADACSSLEKFICGPNMFGATLNNNPVLKYVDMHLSNKATWLTLGGEGPTVEYLDIRHCQKGVAATTFPDPEADYWPNCESGSIQFGTALKDNCLIKIDSYFLYRHQVDNCWAKIYKAWKNGTTIEVYSCIEIDELLGTVPAYADDPTALSNTSWDILEGEEEGYTTNGYKIDDPYTERDETAVRPS